MIIIQKINEVYVRVHTDEPHVIKEISTFFSYEVPDAAFNMKKFPGWNGKKSLFNSFNGEIYIGLLPKLTKFLDKNQYEYIIEGKFNAQEFSLYEAKEFVKSLDLPFEVRDYQLKYFVKCVRNQRAICVSPTSSGKSLIIYLIYRYFDEKTLLIVPTTSLVEQMRKDFISYGYKDEEDIHMIYSGKEKTNKKKLTISTWQSIYSQPQEFFDGFEVLLGDEVHGFKASSLVRIVLKMSNTPIKIGFTGTLTRVDYYDHIIEGLFGPECQYITTKKMMDENFSSRLTIKGIVLYHKDYEFRKTTIPYADECQYIISNEKRNNFITNLAVSLKGNTFVMFRNILHGKELYEKIKNKANCVVYYVDGSTPVSERELIREALEKDENSISVVSTVFGTGINITSINSIIFTHPSKSRVKILQAIGRGLRISDKKYTIELFDLSDDITNFKNITLNHFSERLKIYKEEEFDLKLYKVNI
jgi:superfamily II DNA or RNA helicase